MALPLRRLVMFRRLGFTCILIKYILHAHIKQEITLSMLAVNDKASGKVNEVSGVASLWRREEMGYFEFIQRLVGSLADGQ